MCTLMILSVICGNEHCFNNVCEAQMDMNEVESIASMGSAACPFYRVNNEYKLVEKQN